MWRDFARFVLLWQNLKLKVVLARRTAAIAPLLCLAAALAPAVTLAHAPESVPKAEPVSAHALADCNGALFRTLRPQSSAAIPASAVWLDQTQLLAPGAAAANQFRLHFSRDGRLSARKGRAVTGAQRAIKLAVERAPLSAELSARFSYLGNAVRLRVAEPDRTLLALAMRGQVILTEEDAQSRVISAQLLQIAAFLDAQYAAANAVSDLGVWVNAANPGTNSNAISTQFKLWAPTARAVSLCVYPDAERAASALHTARFDPRTGVWAFSASSNLSGQSYRYLVDVYTTGTGLVRNLVTDPYSISLNADSERSYIADLDAPALAPPGWAQGLRGRTLAAATDMAIYELHVRDFSINDASVTPAHRGKYLAFTEAASNGMAHLKALAKAGMTDLHLLPVFDFATVPEANCVTPAIAPGGADSLRQQAQSVAAQRTDCFNWGYDPWHFGAPEGSYASSPGDGANRIIEFRAMVDALHRAGLRVGMDLVYNHTASSGLSEHSVLDRIVPGYYQRLNASGVVERSTCCDNTATENIMMQKLMVDTTVRWVRDYRIDSFRFDLMGHQPLAAMQLVQRAVDQAAERHVQLVGEGWNFGEVANNQRFVQAAQLSLAGSGIASFSDRARDAMRGGGCCDSGAALVREQGYLNGLYYAPNGVNSKALRAAGPQKGTDHALARAADWARLGLAGSIKSYAMETFDGSHSTLAQMDYGGQPGGYVDAPGEVVNYVENHDNPTLFDINALKLPIDTSAAERARVQMLGAAFVAFSQGIPYFHAGMETLRSKSMDRNSFDSGDWFNRLDWTFSDNYFATGLPPKPDNGANYAWLKPVLGAPIKPTARDIRWTRDVFLALLEIRASTRLLRLDSAGEIKARLRFLNTGVTQEPTVLAAVLSGKDLADAGFDKLAYFINVDTKAHRIVAPDQAGLAYVLHPVQQRENYADKRVLESGYDAETGAFWVPARTAVVFVTSNTPMKN
jgi:pullulanase